MKSLLTTSSSVYPSTPDMAPSAAAFMAALMSAMVVLLLVRKVKSTHDTSAVGTRKAMPVSLPLVSGKHKATALAEARKERLFAHESGIYDGFVVNANLEAAASEILRHIHAHRG